MLPGFYDAHGHILMAAQVRGRVNLNSPPLGACRTLGDILAAIRARAAETPDGEWVLACGLDDTLLEENGSPAVGNWMRRPRIIPCSHSIFPGICAF